MGPGSVRGVPFDHRIWIGRPSICWVRKRRDRELTPIFVKRRSQRAEVLSWQSMCGRRVVPWCGTTPARPRSTWAARRLHGTTSLPLCCVVANCATIHRPGACQLNYQQPPNKRWAFRCRLSPLSRTRPFQDISPTTRPILLLREGLIVIGHPHTGEF